MSRSILARIAAGIFLSLIAIGCSSHPDAIRSGYQYDFAASPGPSKLAVLGAGATVQIKFLRTPELDETQLVRSDGRISMPMIGDVNVAGKTPSEVRDTLIRAYAGKLKSPEIRVLVQKQANRRVYVGGQVQRAGVISMPGRMTALEAIMQAGGPDMREAEISSVLVIRHEGDTRRGYLVDLSQSLAGGAATPFHLRDNDVVYVPRTTIAKIDQWVDQHINKLFPQFGLFYRKQLSPSTEFGFGTNN